MALIQISARLNPIQLRRAQKALGAKTTSETLQRALDFITAKSVHDRTLQRYSGVGNLMLSAKTTKLALLDTAVYLENFRSGRFTFRLLQSPYIIRCSSVVLHELLRGARTVTERKFVLMRPPNCASWLLTC
jgi:hypothetical protein